MHRTFLLVRHCQATGQAPDAPLTPAGEVQARQLTVTLAREPVDRIISSPYLRAVRTIQPFAASRGLTVETDERLTERVLSAEALANWRELLRASFDDLHARLPGGESSHEAMTRARAVVRDVLAGSARCTLLVTHGNLLALLLRTFDDTHGFETWASLRNPDVYRVHFHGERANIERMNIPDAVT